MDTDKGQDISHYILNYILGLGEIILLPINCQDILLKSILIMTILICP